MYVTSSVIGQLLGGTYGGAPCVSSLTETFTQHTPIYRTHLSTVLYLDYCIRLCIAPRAPPPGPNG